MTVDILFPYYGDVAMMKQAVLSVVGQTNPDWRLIVVDDGYPDDSIPGWFESLKDERITYMRNETNLGANANYRKCLTFVENELVTVMGADDVMLPNYVQWLVDAAAKHPEASIFQPGETPQKREGQHPQPAVRNFSPGTPWDTTGTSPKRRRI